MDHFMYIQEFLVFFVGSSSTNTCTAQPMKLPTAQLFVKYSSVDIYDEKISLNCKKSMPYEMLTDEVTGVEYTKSRL